MKHTILTVMAAMLGVATPLMAQSVSGVRVADLSTTHSGEYLVVDMNLHLDSLCVEQNRAVLITPRLVNGQDSTELRSVGVYGRRRYYYYVRNGESMLTGPEEQSFRASHKPDTLAYHALVPYADWMNGATLVIRRSDWGCCNSLLAEQDGTLGHYSEAFFPTLVYVTPKAETTKSRSLEGSAYIDFPVNQTVIYPDYRRNTAELGKIEATIDSVRNDKDITITSVWLKGYASPESPYKHNADLAIGRTAALKSHIQQLYKFDNGIISTAYEPEDWQGLREYVEKSNLEHRTEILDLIDSNLDPDAKEQRIKKSYPDEYRFLLQNCYPALRHTDYRIAYNIRTYSDVEEIKQVMKTQPQKLSLNEFYLVAQNYEPGTEEFTEVFETAVRMYPADESANLNAANAALRRDDLTAAARYLARAGNSAEAVYARGAYAIRSERYDEARTYLKQASSMGLKKADEILQQINNRK